jgi:hypothetical protein
LNISDVKSSFKKNKTLMVDSAIGVVVGGLIVTGIQVDINNRKLIHKQEQAVAAQSAVSKTPDCPSPKASALGKHHQI